MAQRSVIFPPPPGRPTDAPPVRADAHLVARASHAGMLPALSRPEELALHGLAVPEGPGPLPEDIDGLAPEGVARIAVAAGLVVPVYENARRAGLGAIADALRLDWERQRFIGRERWNTARTAVRRLRDATGVAPVALGALAVTSAVLRRPEVRLHDRVAFLVPEPRLQVARTVVADLAGVDVVPRVLRGARRRPCEEALWLRATEPTDEGWRLPSLEDLLLLVALQASKDQGPARLGTLVDLEILTEQPRLHWETAVQRAAIWRLRPRVWHALLDAARTVGADVPGEVLRRLRPTALERVADAISGG